MASVMKRPRLSAVRALTNFRARLTFIDGNTFVLDFKPLMEESKALAPLRNANDFAKLKIIAGEGWTLNWPALDIQIGADTLLLDALAQTAVDEDTRTFLRWRARFGLSLSRAAEALGVSVRTISSYGTKPVPHHIALACVGWEALRERNR